MSAGQPNPSKAEEPTTQVRTFCRVCEPACGLLATVKNNQLIELRPDKEHPISKGFVCNKGIYGKDIHNDPDRLRYPLRRTIDGSFEQISWATALTEISEKLTHIKNTHGSGALGSYTGNPTAYNTLFGPSFGGLMRHLGVRKHFSSGTQDCANKFAGSEAVFGTRTLHPVPDIGASDFILIIGENPAISHMSFVSLPHPMKHLKDAVTRGATVRYINPRRIEAAAQAGDVTFIKPDTDVYLLAALIAQIDQTCGFDEQAVAAHGANVDTLRNFVAQFPLDKVAQVTGIPAPEIQQLAQDFAKAPSACAHMSTGVNMGRQGTLAYWLLHMLVFVTGNLGKAGGNFFSEGFYARSPSAGKSVPEGYVETPYGNVRKPGGVGINLPGNLLADYITDEHEPIRALFVNSGNPVLSIGGEAHMRHALKSVELMVCVDIYRNATAEYAHYILPAAGAFEREDINITGLGLQYQPSVQFTEAVVPPAFERKPEWWIYEKLAQHLALPSAFDGDNDTPNMWGRVDAMLRSNGRSIQGLRDAQIIAIDRANPDDFYTRYLQHEDQRVDCCPTSFDDAQQRMLRIFDELRVDANTDTLKLISKRDGYMINSWYSNVDKLKQGKRDRNYLFMHPNDAQLRQIDHGVTVRVHNNNGQLETEVCLTDELMPGVVAMTHGWGHRNSSGMTVAQQKHGVNCNVLLPSGVDSYEPLSNQAHMTGIPVEVVPV